MIVCSCLLAGAGPVRAQQAEPDPRNGYGIRTGFGLDPDQYVAGVQALLGERFGILRFAPSADAGFGDDQSTYAFNADFTVPLPLPGSRSRLYAGAGPALVVWDPKDGGADTEIGFNLLAGTRMATHGRTMYNVEVRAGLGDAPDFRVLLGVLFGSGRPAAAR